MRSIFVKILLWFAATLIVCLAASTMNAFRHRFAPGRHDFFSRSVSYHLHEARTAYRTGGSAGLQSYFAHLQKYFPGSYKLLDRNNTDLVTGENRDDLMRQVRPHRWRTRGRAVMAWPSRDGAYWLVVDMVIPAGPWSLTSSYLWILVVTVLFCYLLAIYLASPLRRLTQVVERFGSGDLQVRADTKRRDEFGDLAATFNVMAGRIETLLTAERRLLQDVSHELRSPLARLEFAVELARTSSDRERSFGRINKEMERLSKLVSELLLVTRAENEPSSRATGEIALEELLREVVEDSGVEAQARNCRVHFVASERATVAGDGELLRRAVENVVRNAIRFAPYETPVEVKLELVNGTATMSVRDYGPGVSEEDLGKLCNPFFRAETDRNRHDGGGVGLGLSIAERALTVHGGSLRVRNAHPGLLVTMELPATARQPLLAMT